MFVHEMKEKMADSRFVLSNQNIVEKQKHVENYTDLVECLANMGD